MLHDIRPPTPSEGQRIELDTTRTQTYRLVRLLVYLLAAVLPWGGCYLLLSCTPAQERAVLRGAQVTEHGCRVVQLVSSDEVVDTACLTAEEVAELVQAWMRHRLAKRDAEAL